MLLMLIPAVATAVGSAAQSRPPLSKAVSAYVTVDAPVVALTHVRVIDGTGAPPRDDQTLIIRDGKIAAIGSATSTPPPEGATVIDLTGKSVIPGLVMVHEHLYYPTGPGVYGQLGESFTRLYLSGGVTTMRTGGNVNGFMDMNMKQLIESGQKPGPDVDATAPYFNGPNPFMQMRTLKGPEDSRRQVQYWTDEGATSLKTYMKITRAELAAAINEAHRREIKVTGHLCSVTYAEAARLGIDNLEHGFFAATDFVADKKPDQCPGQGVGQKTIAALDENGAPFKTLVQTLIDRDVALTSTLTVFETFTPGRPKPRGLEVLTPQLREQFEQNYERTSKNKESIYSTLFAKGMALERAFARAGGLLIAGTDPTGGGGVIPGFANQRQAELLVDAGFTPLEAITISTLERRQVSRPRCHHRNAGRRQAGGPRCDQRQSCRQHCRYPQGRDRVQAGCWVRPGQADCIGHRPGRPLVIQGCQGCQGARGAGVPRVPGCQGCQGAKGARVPRAVFYTGDVKFVALSLSFAFAIVAAVHVQAPVKGPTSIDKSDPVAGAVARGVAFLRVEVPKWKAEHPCYSCHNNGDATRALIAAAARRARHRHFARRHADLPEATRRSGIRTRLRTASTTRRWRACSSRARSRWPSGTVTPPARILTAAAKLLVADQKADGSWTLDQSQSIASPATYGTIIATASARTTLAVVGQGARRLHDRPGRPMDPRADSRERYRCVGRTCLRSSCRAT